MPLSEYMHHCISYGRMGMISSVTLIIDSTNWVVFSSQYKPASKLITKKETTEPDHEVKTCKFPKRIKTTVQLTGKKSQAPTHPTHCMQSEKKETEVEKICVSEENSLSGDSHSNTEAVSLLPLTRTDTHSCQIQG